MKHTSSYRRPSHAIPSPTCQDFILYGALGNPRRAICESAELMRSLLTRCRRSPNGAVEAVRSSSWSAAPALPGYHRSPASEQSRIFPTFASGIHERHMQFRFTTHCSPGFTVACEIDAASLGENGPERTFDLPYQLPYLVMYPLPTVGESTSTAEGSAAGSALQDLGVPLTCPPKPQNPAWGSKLAIHQLIV